MKHSHTTTPRTLADCTFTYGYTSVRSMGYRESKLERVAGYVLATVIGSGMAALLVAWWSS
jgi:hypothetical protein